MRYESFWQSTAPVFDGAAAGPVEGTYDVAVVGGGFTGLSAARRLAMGGAKVVLLEADRVGAGGSGRNGGHLNNGIAHGYADAEKHFGAERAKALYLAYDAAIEEIERVIAEEGISCDFRRSGKLKLASKPSHVAGLRANFERIHAAVDPDTAFLEAKDLAGEIGSPAFHAAMRYDKSAMMHMGRYVHGLAEAVIRRGATIFEKAPVTARRTIAGGTELTTPRGTVTAKTVMVATGAYTPSTFAYHRRRLISVGSFIVATRPLTEAEIAATMPGNRTCVTSFNIGNYFRLAPDNRLIFGGRARFSAVSDQTSDAKSGHILRASLGRIFPQLGEIELEYCWGGLVGMTADRFPRAGFADGVFYAMGYSGHGAHMANLMGTIVADEILGRATPNPLQGLSWPAIPFYSGKPWFLPLVGLWFKFLDATS